MGSSDAAAALRELHDEVMACRRCDLHRSRTQAVPGDGAADADVVFVGEAPGYEEDRQGRPFVGPAGALLTRLLQGIGLERDEVFITNVVKCRPPSNRDPQPEEISACNDYLLAQIALITPKVICALGRFAAQTLIDPKLSISREHGRPRRMSGILYMPIYHPAAALHQPRYIDALESDFQQLRNVVKGAVTDASRPESAGSA